MNETYTADALGDEPQVLEGGTSIVFSIKTVEAQEFSFKLSTDGLDAMLASLEWLARQALMQRMANHTIRTGPSPAVPAFRTHANRFAVEEGDDANHYLMTISRADRSRIEIPLDKKGFESFRRVMTEPPALAAKAKAAN